MVEFKSNVELLDNEKLDIPAIVQKVQALAKKQVECLNLMHSFGLNQLQNTQVLFSAKKDLSSKLAQAHQIRGQEASQLISFAIQYLDASETQVKTMFGRVNC